MVYQLFVCETVFQLMTAINIKYHLYPNTDADIALTMSTDLSRYMDALSRTGLFKKIYRSEYYGPRDQKKILDAAPNRSLMKHPEKYAYSFPLVHQYSDYFMASNTTRFLKVVYYHLIKLGTTPRVHIYDEGANPYFSNIESLCRNDSLDHTIYRSSERFINNIAEVLLYAPELYSGGEDWVLSAIPKIKESDTEFVGLLKLVFGECVMPNEKYIFFNECFSIERIASNDIQILDRIGGKVGKENVTVKLHPRTPHGEELYRLHGYSIFAEKTIPWEMFVLDANIEDKVLISVSSNTIINPKIVFDKNVNALYLWKVMKLSKRWHVTQSSYQTFLKKTMQMLNEEETRLFCPGTVSELDTIIDYLERVI